MCKNNLFQLNEAVESVLPFVDYVVLVDGGSDDCTLFHFHGREDEGIHLFLHPWKDHFSEQRNNYIKRAREVVGSDSFWILVSDPDEHFDSQTLMSLRGVQSTCVSRRLNSAMFRCRSESYIGNRKVWENLDDYRKLLFFSYEPGMEYRGNPHEHLVFPSGNPRPLVTDLIYSHKKWESVIWERGCRNYWIQGGGDNAGVKNQLWVELRQLTKDYYGRDLSWAEFQRELVYATIPDTVKSWMINKARLDTGWSGSSESRENYKYFFRFLHAELEPEELRGTYIE